MNPRPTIGRCDSCEQDSRYVAPVRIQGEMFMVCDGCRTLVVTDVLVTPIEIPDIQHLL